MVITIEAACEEILAVTYAASIFANLCNWTSTRITHVNRSEGWLKSYRRTLLENPDEGPLGKLHCKALWEGDLGGPLSLETGGPCWRTLSRALLESPIARLCGRAILEVP